MEILESIGKALGIESLQNVVPSLKKAYEVAFKNNDKSFLEKISLFYDSYTQEKDKLDKEKKGIAASTDEKVKATLKGVQTPEVTAVIKTPDGPSVVDSIKVRLKDGQKAMSRLIERMFTERLKQFDKGLSDEAIRRIVIAALANAYGESSFNPNLVGDGVDSVGLFQLNRNGLGHGMYKSWKEELKTNPSAPDPRKDPVKNISKILDNVTGNLGKSLIARAKAGAEIPELIKIFCYEIENPAKKALNTNERIAFAKSFFGGDLSRAPNAVASSAPAAIPVAPNVASDSHETLGKNLHFPIDLGGIKHGLCDLASGQRNWFFGSSSVAGMSKSMGGRLGIVGVNANEFLQNLKSTWWNKIETAGLKPPYQVVITGLGQNSVSNDSSVRQALVSYEGIRSFLSSKGVNRIKFITVNPGGKYGVFCAKFNEELVRKYGSNCVDVRPYTTTADGSKVKDEFDGGIHLNGKGKKEWRKVVLSALNESPQVASR